MLAALKHPKPIGTARFIRHSSPQLMLQKLKNSYKDTTLRNNLQLFLSLKMTPAILTPFYTSPEAECAFGKRPEPYYDKAIFKFSRKIAEIFLRKRSFLSTA
ncbi:hypothetical protein [Pantoea sp. Lij88]|uniref:hypothetical protein n=1 Tax=Pantoea sp. Lij88 TaxID=3028622 RepID=UPI0024BA5D88|nr:hypothetical protein [Pantoea sp. Lij88]WHQ77288.1 hypothetical protein PU624_09910 [Pantoea sp. Lij88]